MDGIGTSIQSRINYFLDIQVSILQFATAQGASLVGHAAMQGVGIVVGKDRHRGDVQLAQSLDDAHRNFSPIGNQHLIDFLAVHVVSNDSAKIQKERQPLQIAFQIMIPNINFSKPRTSRRSCWHPR